MELPGLVRTLREGLAIQVLTVALPANLVNFKSANGIQHRVEVVSDTAPSELDHRNDLAAGKLLNISGTYPKSPGHNLEIGQPRLFIDFRFLFLGSHGDWLDTWGVSLSVFEFFLKSHGLLPFFRLRRPNVSVVFGTIARSDAAHFERNSDHINADRSGKVKS